MENLKLIRLNEEIRFIGNLSENDNYILCDLCGERLAIKDYNLCKLCKLAILKSELKGYKQGLKDGKNHNNNIKSKNGVNNGN